MLVSLAPCLQIHCDLQQIKTLYNWPVISVRILKVEHHLRFFILQGFQMAMDWFVPLIFSHEYANDHQKLVGLKSDR